MKLRRSAVSVGFILFAAAIGIVSQPAKVRAREAKASYHLLKKVVLRGEGGWDLLTCDSEARRIYISCGTHVMVVDADTYAVVGDIPDTNGVHGIALAPEFGRGFTSNGRANNVTIFDLKTLKTLGQVSTGAGPDAILYDPASHRVFTFNGGSNDATAIDAATGSVAATIPLGGGPEFAVADGKGLVYVNLEDKSEVVEIDSQGLSVKAHWSLAPCERPSGMAIDRKHGRLFIGCHNKMMAVMDAASGKVLATPPIGAGVDANGFDPETRLAFSSNGEGNLTVVHEDSPDEFTVVASVETQPRARTMALDLKTHNVLLVTAEFDPAPPATAERPRPRPTMKPGTFTLLVFGR